MTTSACFLVTETMLILQPSALSLAALCGDQLLHPDPAALLRLLVLAPLLEEGVIRAGLQEWLMRRAWRPGWWTVLASATCFSALHLGRGPLTALAVFGPALALGLLYQYRRDWRLCAAAHAVMNGAGLVLCSLLV